MIDRQFVGKAFPVYRTNVSTERKGKMFVQNEVEERR